MRTKLVAAGVAAALVAGTAVAAIAMAPTPTKVTIQAQQGGFFGDVHSSKQDPCELNRKVKLFKQTGSVQKPHSDTLIGTDIAQPNGSDSQWSINTNKHGRFYARTPAKGICAAGASKTIHSQ
jgi:hypothetical protein